MKIQYWSLALVLALGACSTTAPTQNDVNEAVSSSAGTTQMETSSVPQTQSSVLPMPESLDREFSSQKLGIAVRYPSTAVVGDCADPISVTAREKEYSVEFVLDHAPDPTCAEVPGNVFNIIYAQRVSTKTDLRQFIDKVFSPNCEITYEGEEDGDEFTGVFLRSKNPPTDAPDFECSESVAWNRTAGVAMFSPLGSKNGGGIDWPSRLEIQIPEGITYQAFDFLIMDSIRYLKP
jgi:hypothetical protein